ncbi:hypothetical protein P0L94_11525 [Microbacter sp. GSS18]|nr:hypothetical protein P0L94_11525 [Microbacter sp. GSS18]
MSADIRWMVTTRSVPWRRQDGVTVAEPTRVPDVLVQLDRPAQRMEGFGACVSEDMPVSLLVGERVVSVDLPADSFSTIVVPRNCSPTRGVNDGRRDREHDPAGCG